MAPQESYAGDYREQHESAAAARDEGWMLEILARFEAHREGDEFAASQAQRLEQGMETREGPVLPGTHYPGFDHPTLKSMVDTNLDAGQVNENGAAWNELGNTLVEFRDTVSRAAARSEVDWSGAAGDAARGYFSGLGEWMGGTGQGFQLAANRMNAQSEAAAQAKNAMPEPVDFGMNDAVTMLQNERNPFNLQNTINQINQRFAEKREAHDRAAEVMAGYAGAMGSSGAGMPAFAPAPAMANASGGDTGEPGGPEGGPGRRPGGPSAPLEVGAWSEGASSGGPDGGDGGSPRPDIGGGPNGADAGPSDSSSEGDTSTQGVQPGRGPVGGSERPLVPATGGRETLGLPDGGLPIGGLPFGGPGPERGGGRGPDAGGGRGSGPGSPGGSGGPRGGGPGGPGAGVRGVPGAVAAKQAAVGRGGAAGGMGLAPMAAGRGQGGGDAEHQRPGWLVEPDPEGVFGADEVTAPPVLGADEPVSEER